MEVVSKVPKKIVSILAVVFVCILSLGDVKAYEFPSTAFYVKFRDKSLGEVTLYIPSNQVEYLSLEEETQIVNVSSSNITGYSPDHDYTFSFQPFYYGRYRPNNTTSYQYLDIQSIIDTNIHFLTDENVFISQNHDHMLLACSMLAVGGILLVWLKR